MTNNAPQLSALTATTARRSYTLSYLDRPSSGAAILYVHLQVLEKAKSHAYYDYSFQIECAVVEIPNANLPIGVFNIRQRRNLK
jgi:hypothetical protein